ncbi:autotransporter-associated beta strand repeat-containing protein [Glycomyces lechevalierae]|uniref:Autotransporter-associated beta strand protein n=1 Tax=Glycomyces lechevalierae TaxID=256034 RepID=A0A9X3PDG2_9ACTN|nr:autotransporter-associated beta strand repeat-containing protein [Glycomyces lechevalierae]MDA1383574.1 autotransporter-associated beta strand repeat-containing protein [Glycomyces lechevalierae]MDR7341437.1 autotransporter-associated beta strand protein [Glycomyces lechevalierae]
MKDSHTLGPPRGPAIGARLLLAAALAFLTAPFAAAPAQAANDITGQIRAGQDVVLNGDAVVNLGDGEEITYGGHFSGVGTLTISGSGKLILTANSDFSIPEDRQTQTVEARGEPWWWNTIENPDPPAVTIEAGATLQYGDGTSTTGTLGHYPYDLPNFEWNALNHQVDGTLIVAVHGGRYHPGNLSGSGFIVQPRGTWDGLALAGNHTFSGVLYNGTAVHYSQREFLSTMPEVDTIVNQGSFIIDTQDGNDTVLDADFYSREWGNDINFHSQIFGSKVVMSGVYSWADSGPDTDPSLSDPDLNYEVVAHNHNKRGINIEGALVQWGDGTDNEFFLPGNRDTVYINMHARRMRSHLILNYNGPVRLDAPISGGIFHDTMSAVGVGDVTIAGTAGNDVTFADQQNYDGATTIESDAILRLGAGEDGGDGWLLTGGEQTAIVDDGALVVDNVEHEASLEDISGAGSLEQAGSATVTLTGGIEYTGATTVSGGTLALTGGDLAASEHVELSGESAVLDLSQVEGQTVHDLSGVAGAALRLGADDLALASATDTAYAGSVEGEGGLVKTGPGAWTYAGTSTATGAWTVAEGTLVLGGAPDGGATEDGAESSAPAEGATEVGAELAGGLVVDQGLTVRAASVVGGDLSLGEASTLTVGSNGGLAVAGEATLGGTLAVAYEEGAALPEEITVVTAAAGATGTFANLAQDAELEIGGTTYRIAYEADKVVLRTDTPQEAAAEAAGAGPGAAGSPWWAYAVGVSIGLLLVALALLFWLRRRRRSGLVPDDATLELPTLKA